MTPLEKLELEACLRRVGEILYNDSDPENLKNLEDIEKTVRKKILEEVSPRIGFSWCASLASCADAGSHPLFLSNEKQKLAEEKKEL